MFVGFSITIVGVWLFKFVVYRTFHILTLSYILYKRKNVGYINPEFERGTEHVDISSSGKIFYRT